MRSILTLIAATLAVSGSSVLAATEAEHGLAATALAAKSANTNLETLAKVSQSEARATALAKVRGGSVQSAELEEEGGRLVWSFDISRPKVRSVVEVLVDAKTGAIVSKKNESPAEQAKEAKADKLAKP